MTSTRFAIFWTTGIILLAVGMHTLAQGRAHEAIKEYPTPLVREQQQVIIRGVTEVWELRWRAKPKPVCEPVEDSLMCPCMGFAYGEGGDLDLVRTREGVEIERLNLTPLFAEGFAERKIAVVQRWAPDGRKDLAASSKPGFARAVSKRPAVRVMNFADYNHDGDATEFFLQTETAPCGKSIGPVVGVSAADPHLHVFGTASRPKSALYLQKREWTALRDASGPVDVVDWRCGDHASETQTVLHLGWTAKGIDGSRREFQCTADDRPGRLIREGPLSSAK